MKYKKRGGSEMSAQERQMLRGGGMTSKYHREMGEHMKDEPIGRAMKRGRNVAGRSSGGKKRR